MGYLVSPYPYPNGAGGPIPVSMVSPVMLFFVLFSLKIWHASDLPLVCNRIVPLVLDDNDASVSFVPVLIWLRQTVPCLPSWIVITLLIYGVRKLDSRFIFTAPHSLMRAFSFFSGRKLAPRASDHVVFSNHQKIYITVYARETTKITINFFMLTLSIRTVCERNMICGRVKPRNVAINFM